MQSNSNTPHLNRAGRFFSPGVQPKLMEGNVCGPLGSQQLAEDQHCDGNHESQAHNQRNETADAQFPELVVVNGNDAAGVAHTGSSLQGQAGRVSVLTGPQRNSEMPPTSTWWEREGRHSGRFVLELSWPRVSVFTGPLRSVNPPTSTFWGREGRHSGRFVLKQLRPKSRQRSTPGKGSGRQGVLRAGSSCALSTQPGTPGLREAVLREGLKLLLGNGADSR